MVFPHCQLCTWKIIFTNYRGWLSSVCTKVYFLGWMPYFYCHKPTNATHTHEKSNTHSSIFIIYYYLILFKVIFEAKILIARILFMSWLLMKVKLIYVAIYVPSCESLFVQQLNKSISSWESYSINEISMHHWW